MLHSLCQADAPGNAGSRSERLADDADVDIDRRVERVLRGARPPRSLASSQGPCASFGSGHRAVEYTAHLVLDLMRRHAA